MVYCVQLQAAFTSAARRDAVLADIQTWIAGKSRWSVDVLQAVPLRFGANGIQVELRFTSQADADGLKTRVESFATGVRTPIPESWVRVHTCTHDEGTNTCNAIVQRLW